MASEIDIENISALIIESTFQNPNNYTEEQKKAWITYNSVVRIKSFLTDRQIICLYQENELLGTVSLKNDEIFGFYVNHKSRGKGFGTMLLKKAEELAFENGVFKIHLSSTPSAFGFYKKHGFKANGNIVVTILGVDFEETAMHKFLY